MKSAIIQAIISEYEIKLMPLSIRPNGGETASAQGHLSKYIAPRESELPEQGLLVLQQRLQNHRGQEK